MDECEMLWQVQLARQECLDPQAETVQLARTGHRDRPDPRDLWVSQERPATQADQVYPDQLETAAHLAHKV